MKKFIIGDLWTLYHCYWWVYVLEELYEHNYYFSLQDLT